MSLHPDKRDYFVSRGGALMLRKFTQAERDYPRPAPPMYFEVNEVTGWKGAVKVSENGWDYSVEYFDTEAEAIAWAINEVQKLMKG